MRNDYRNYLFETYLAIVRNFKPKAFIFENVLGLLSAKPNDVMISELIRKAFDDIGYTIIDDLSTAVIDVSDYGVPQYRKRLIIVGLRKSEFRGDIQKILLDFYSNILPKFKSKKITVKDALFDLPKMRVVNKGKQSHTIIGSKSIPNHFLGIIA
jgi:DNA (cytosine-5)-methyltransferase 1